MKLLEINQTIRNIKIIDEYHEPFHEDSMKDCPFEQFVEWFSIALQKEPKPTIMTLATVDEEGLPHTRSIALQELEMNRLIFYSTYDCRKAQHIDHKNSVAVNFYWPNLARQIRIRANIKKLERQKSVKYFSNRKREIQLTIHAWKQSTPIASREDLEDRIKNISTKFKDKPIPCPKHWGGYVIIPFEYEFYQRRENFLNDIFLYTLQDGCWQRVRLAP
jgi:pyridoxamine 5'-phosphate oxidase